MSLKYALLENLLTASNDDYTAQVQDISSHDFESIIEQMIQKGSTITKTDTLAVLNSFFEVAADITKNGETINTDLFKTNLSISGVFNGAADTFDSSRHSINVNVNAGKVLKDSIRGIRVEKTTANEVLPHILEVKDSVSGSINNNITSGGVMEIIGSMLKITGENTTNGISLIATDGTAHKITTIIDNKPARLIAIVPTLTAGEYTLQITTQYNGGGNGLKVPRTGTFNKTLTVYSIHPYAVVRHFGGIASRCLMA